MAKPEGTTFQRLDDSDISRIWNLSRTSAGRETIVTDGSAYSVADYIATEAWCVAKPSWVLHVLEVSRDYAYECVTMQATSRPRRRSEIVENATLCTERSRASVDFRDRRHAD